MDDLQSADSEPNIPKRERSLAFTLLACIVAAAALTAVGYAIARIIAPAFLS